MKKFTLKNFLSFIFYTNIKSDPLSAKEQNTQVVRLKDVSVGGLEKFKKFQFSNPAQLDFEGIRDFSFQSLDGGLTSVYSNKDSSISDNVCRCIDHTQCPKCSKTLSNTISNNPSKYVDGSVDLNFEPKSVQRDDSFNLGEKKVLDNKINRNIIVISSSVLNIDKGNVSSKKTISTFKKFENEKPKTSFSKVINRNRITNSNDLRNPSKRIISRDDRSKGQNSSINLESKKASLITSTARDLSTKTMEGLIVKEKMDNYDDKDLNLIYRKDKIVLGSDSSNKIDDSLINSDDIQKKEIIINSPKIEQYKRASKQQYQKSEKRIIKEEIDGLYESSMDYNDLHQEMLINVGVYSNLYNEGQDNNYNCGGINSLAIAVIIFILVFLTYIIFNVYYNKFE